MLNRATHRAIHPAVPVSGAGCGNGGKTPTLNALNPLLITPLFVVLASAVLWVGGCYESRRPPVQNIQSVQIVLEEKLGVDDVFEVRVHGEPDLTGAFRVAADGSIDFPFVGRFQVLGLRSGDVQRLIAGELRDGYLKNPQVSVMVTEWNSRKISVLGQVKSPGPITYFPSMTIVDAIAAAGGFTGLANKNAVTVRREAKGAVRTRTYPVADISAGRSPNAPVVPGDVLVVGERLF